MVIRLHLIIKPDGRPDRAAYCECDLNLEKEMLPTHEQMEEAAKKAFRVFGDSLLTPATQ